MRPFNQTGPGQSAEFVVSAFARQVARIALGLQDPVLNVGALDPERDFLDVRDVCRVYAACLDHALPAGTILNVASGQQRRIGSVLADLLAAAGVTASVETVRDGSVRRTFRVPRVTPVKRGNAWAGGLSSPGPKPCPTCCRTGRSGCGRRGRYDRARILGLLPKTSVAQIACAAL